MHRFSGERSETVCPYANAQDGQENNAMRQLNRVDLGLVGALLALAVGCSGSPEAVGVPDIDPTAAADAAISQFDNDGNGQLSVEELASCPALLGAIKRYDKNQDGQIAKEEMAERFEMWVEGGVGISTLACRVLLDQKPLVGAQVKLVPESIFGGAIEPATGTTNASGTAVLAIDNAHLPSDMQNVRGVRQGLFKVEITHSDMAIPSKYNTETTLGKEVSFETGENYIVLELSSQ